MSINGLRIGGSCPSNPPSTLDKIKLAGALLACAVVFFGSLIGGIKWWVFG